MGDGVPINTSCGTFFVININVRNSSPSDFVLAHTLLGDLDVNLAKD